MVHTGGQVVAVVSGPLAGSPLKGDTHLSGSAIEDIPGSALVGSMTNTSANFASMVESSVGGNHKLSDLSVGLLRGVVNLALARASAVVEIEDHHSKTKSELSSISQAKVWLEVVLLNPGYRGLAKLSPLLV